MRNLLFFLGLSLFFACGDAGTKVGSSSATGSNTIDGEIVPGFTYVNHTKKGGATPQLTEYAYFNYYVMDGDSLMFSNTSQGAPQKVLISNDFEGRNAGQKPLILALQKMAIGDSLSLFIPRDSLPPSNNLKSDRLTYHISLEDIKDEATFLIEMEAEKAIKQKEMVANQARESEIAEMVSLRAKEYTRGSLDGKIKTTASGLKYIIHEEGNGATPQPGQNVFANYFGALTNGTPFDNSWKRGQLFNFPIGQGRVIKGWDEGFALLKPGAKATFFIPADLGYGATGSPPTIPPNSELVFYVEFDSAR